MGRRAGLDGVAVVLEAGNCALGIVDFEDPFDLTVKNRTVDGRFRLLRPTGIKNDLHYLPAGILWPQL